MSVLTHVLSGLVALALMGAVPVTDPTGDAAGDGTIVAPTAPRYANSAIFDLQEVSLEVRQAATGGSIILLPEEPPAAPEAGAEEPTDTSTAVDGSGLPALSDVRSVVRVTLGAVDVSDSTALGFGSVVIDLYFDVAPGGRETTLEGPGMLMPAGRGWEYAVRLTPDGASGFRYLAEPAAGSASPPAGEPAGDVDPAGAVDDQVIEVPDAPAVDYERVPVGAALSGSTLTVDLPWDFPDDVTVYALTGVHDPFNPTGWRPLAEAPSPWAYSGGEQLVPVVDLIAPSQEAQEGALRTGVLPLPAVAARDSGLLWLVLMALGLCVATAGLLLRRRVPAQAQGRLRTGLPPEPVVEPLVPAPAMAASSRPAAAVEQATDPQAAVAHQEASSPPMPEPVQPQASEAQVTAGASTGTAARVQLPRPMRVVETDSKDQGGPLVAAESEAATAGPDEGGPALSGISAFDSYVLSEALAENEEQDPDEGFDDLA